MSPITSHDRVSVIQTYINYCSNNYILGQQIWNDIPYHTNQSDTIPIVKGKLKTILLEMDIVLLMYNMTILLIQQ